jgi:hypothetical protein
MALKLAIENKVAVHIQGVVPGAAKGDRKKVDFHIYMTRLNQEEINASMKEEEPLTAFIKRLADGWDGQRLVLNEDDTPAAFSAEALEQLFLVPGMPMWIYRAYLRDVGIQEKN